VNEPLLFESARLRLQPIHAEDSDEWWQAIWCDADVTRYLPPRKPVPREKMPERMVRVAQHWEAHGLGVWSVRDRHQGSLIGHCGLLLNEPPQVELIYAFARSAWGRGFATEASVCVTTYAFEQRALDHLIALVFPENLASMRVLGKLGFIRAGETERFEVQLLRYILRK
jgi:RimJ/RimL family protein N-acetyltransferase